MKTIHSLAYMATFLMAALFCAIIIVSLPPGTDPNPKTPPFVGLWIGFDPATGRKIGAINNTPSRFTVLDPVRITNENIWLLPVRDRQ